MGAFIGRIAQTFSGFNTEVCTVPVTAQTVGQGTLLVAIGFGITGGIVSSVTDTQGNIYVLDVRAINGPVGSLRCAELWRCTGFAPLDVYDPASGSGDQIFITLNAVQARGISAIVDQFTSLSPPDETSSFSNNTLQNSFKLTGTISAADAAGGISYAVAMPDFTVEWINPPTAASSGSGSVGGNPQTGYALSGPTVQPVAGSSLAAAYNDTPIAGPVTTTWSWGAEAHSFAVILASYPPAPVLTDVAAGSDDGGFSVTVNQVVGGVPTAPQLQFSSLSSSTFSQIVSTYAMPVTPTVTYYWACWAWQAFAADTTICIQINWLNGSLGFISGTSVIGTNATVPTLIAVSGAAPTGAVFAQADVFNFGSPPSPSHAYYAAAAPQTQANWISVPGLNAWSPSTLLGGSLNSVIAAQSEWVAAYGPQNDFGACADFFSVVQEQVV